MEPDVKKNVAERIDIQCNDCLLKMDKLYEVMKAEHAAKGLLRSGATIKRTMREISQIVENYYSTLLEHIRSSSLSYSSEIESEISKLVKDGLQNLLPKLLDKLNNASTLSGKPEMYARMVPEVEVEINNSERRFNNSLNSYVIELTKINRPSKFNKNHQENLVSLFDEKEDARIEKSNGDVIGPYKMLFSGRTIFIDDPKADVEEGDTILRLLPNGKDERSYVTEATFYNKGVGGMGPHYQLEFKKGGATVEHKPVQNFHINNAQSIQIGDHNIQNIVNSFEALVKIIESSSASLAEKEEAKSLLKKFVGHPLVVSILGTATGVILG